MAFYLDEEEVWKCPNHPSKRRRTGICPTCLRERLVTLCPECANTRPCACCPAPIDSTSSSSSSSSSFSRFQFSRGGSLRDGFLSSAAAGEVGRVSNLIESEPAFRKSRSLAIPFLRSRSKYAGADRDRQFVKEDKKPLPRVSRSKINFWSVFRVSKTKKCDVHGDGLEEDSNKSDISAATDDYSRMMRSRSVAVGAGESFSSVAAKRRGWYFPSPMKAFRQSKTSKVQLHERSPMHRG
ncbi:uncharacterized protein LOC112528657 [Cynara cardunculus var. scolymus]|uniref:uncharacterized protein LOC112528657 n=1 Tax=Cynara cardunculus var. scolymus TaxID=59895 RepID=UPI000D630A03|nr:uncharacterized protein LOC112528657 [Cynara cardunculus var. scolymus]